jgi:hypothetical protein
MDLPSNAPQMFQLPAPAQINQQPGLFQGLASGVNQGVQLGQAQQALQQHQQALQQEQHKQQVDSALQFLATTGQQLQYLRPDSQKIAISNSLNALAKVAPEFGIQPHTPDQIPDEAVDLTKSYAKLHEGYLKGDVSLPTFQTEGQNILGEMSLYERNLAKENEGILGTPKLEPGQINGQSVNFNPDTGQSSAQGTGQTVPGNFVPNTTLAREQNTRQMGAAGANAPFVSALKDYHTAVSGLARGDQIGDRTAILAASKFLGETPESMKALAKSGFFGKNIESGITKIWGSGDMTPEQRADFQAVLDTHKQGLEKASAIQTSMYPGATGPNLSISAQPITKTLKSGKTVISSDGGKTWFYSK